MHWQKRNFWEGNPSCIEKKKKKKRSFGCIWVLQLTTPWSRRHARTPVQALKRTQAHGCVHIHEYRCAPKQKHAKRSPSFFLPDIFQPDYFHPLCSVCLLSPLKIISPFLSVYPAFIFLSPSFYLHLAPDSPALLPPPPPPPPPPSPSWLFPSFTSSSPFLPLSSAPSFFFLLMQHSSHSSWLLRGKDPAGRPRPNIITLLSAVLSLSLSLSLSLFLSSHLSPSLPHSPPRSLYLPNPLPRSFSPSFLPPKTSIPANNILQIVAACTLTVLKQLTGTTVFHN